MARYQLDVEKRLASEFWTNVYQLEADSLAVADELSEEIVQAERTFHLTIVSFTRYRVSTVAMNDGVYTIRPVNEAGLRDLGGPLPLFNTLRFDISADTGRPSRKYYRGVLTEGDINGDAVTTSSFIAGATALQALFATPESNGGIVDPQGQFLNGITIHQFVQMRQLRRARRKRQNGDGIFQ